jgi:spore coat polysaccharide biosynthesis predicted glycosyltransferase SpsG
LTFAAALQRRRRPTHFLSQLEPASLGQLIKRAGNEWLEADGPAGTEEDLGETIQEVRRLGTAAVVVDSGDVGENYLVELAASGTRVITLDHLANIRFASQLVINPLLDPGRDAYEFLPGTQLLLGRRYAIVRPEIRRIRQVRAQEPPQPYRALIALGEEDGNESTIKVIRLLLPITRLNRIDAIVRPYSPALAALQELAGSHPERLEIATEPADIAAKVARCHFAVTGGGGWSLELACVGIPQLIIVQAESYWPSARRLEEEGAAVCIGGHENLAASTIRQAIQDLLADPLERQAMTRCARKLIDGRGPDRLVTALEILLHPSRSIDVRQAA